MKRALLAAILLAGCASGPSAADCGASNDLDDGLDDDAAHPIEILALHDERPNRDVVFCVRLDGHGPIGKVMEGSRGVPNTGWIARGAYGSPNVTIDAWIAGREMRANETVDLARTPHVAVVLDGEKRLRIQASGEPIVFA